MKVCPLVVLWLLCTAAVVGAYEVLTEMNEDSVDTFAGSTEILELVNAPQVRVAHSRNPTSGLGQWPVRIVQAAQPVPSISLITVRRILELRKIVNWNACPSCTPWSVMRQQDNVLRTGALSHHDLTRSPLLKHSVAPSQ